MVVGPDNVSNMCSNEGMEASVIDPFPSVSAALADARRLDDQDLCDAIHDAEMALRRHQAHTAVLTAELNSPDPGHGLPAQRRRRGTGHHARDLPAQRRPPHGHRRPGCVTGELLWAALYDGRIDQTKAVMIHDLLARSPTRAAKNSN